MFPSDQSSTHAPQLPVSPPSETTVPIPPRRSPWAAGTSAIRQFARPFVLIQTLAVGLVTLYHLSAGFRGGCAQVAEARVRGGMLFSALASAAAGGVLPELMKWVTRPRAYRVAGRGGELVFNLAFFTLNGLVIDRFYRFLTWLLGGQTSLAVVLGKVAFDQFVFTPIWLLAIVALYHWRANRFRPMPTVRALGADFYRQRVIPLLLPNWAFWLPMTSAIYALPVPLQFLLFTLALAAWSLIMVFIAEGKG